MKIAKRKVRIEREGDTWFVLFVSRNKWQRRCAAQFYAKDWDLEYVQNWVRNHAKLTLCDM